MTADRLAAAYRDHAAELHGFALSLTRDPDDAADVVQDALLRALRSDGSFDAAPPQAWLKTAIRHVVIDRVRRRTAAAVRGEITARAAARYSPAGLGEFEDQLAARLDAERIGPALREALAGLPEHYRAAMLALNVAGESQADLARAAGVSPVTIRGRAHRGRKALWAALAAHAELVDAW